MKKRREKMLAVLLGIIMAASLMGCGSKNGTAATQTQESVVDGGWEFNQGELSLDRNVEAKKAFDRATEGLVGSAYEPVALIGSQVVSGSNYCILCRASAVTPDAKPSFILLYLYADLDGNAKITDTKVLAGGDDAGQTVVGGLTVNAGDIAVDRNRDVKAAFDKALDGLVGCNYEAVAYIGSQVVAGTNYSILCRTTPVVPDAVSSFSIVTVYEDLNGSAELTDVSDLTL